MVDKVARKWGLVVATTATDEGRTQWWIESGRTGTNALGVKEWHGRNYHP